MEENNNQPFVNSALFGFVFVFYGFLLIIMFLSAFFMNAFPDMDWAEPIRNTLQGIIAWLYIPPIILYYFRLKHFLIFLAVAYAYDLWFQLRFSFPSVKHLFMEYPLFVTGLVFSLVFGIIYPGFRNHFRWKLWMRQSNTKDNNDCF